MKKSFFILFLLLLISPILSAESLYRAKCESFLTVRQTQSKKAKALGKIYKDELVTVYDINGEWARVSYNGGEGYVLVSYLTYVSSEPQKTNTAFDKYQSFSKNITDKYEEIKNNITSYLGDTRWLLWLILPLLGIFLLLFTNLREKVSSRAIILGGLLALILSICEIFYGLGCQEFSWFCSDPRWYWVVVNFIIFGICAFCQCTLYWSLSIYFSYGNFKVGLYSWPICVAISIILFIFDCSTDFAWWALAICQLIQIIIIFCKNSFAHALFFAIVYVVFSIATFMVVIQFLQLLIIVALVFLALVIFLSGGGSKSRSSSSNEVELMDEYGHTTKGTIGCGGDIYADDGRVYEKDNFSGKYREKY